MYKLSKYNYIVECGKKNVYFNGITGHTFSLSQVEHEKILNLFNDLISFRIQYTTVFDRFKEWGFIVNEYTDELDIIRYRNKQTVFLNRFYRLAISPTEECIFDCWYCAQHKKNSGRMSSDMINRVKNHIEIMVNDEKITSFHLDWFGGEPLMYFNEVIYPIAIKAAESVNENTLPFTHHLRTNGYLINSNIVRQLDEIKLNSFQITIDGDEKRHNAIRNINGKPTFKRIMDNIALLCENIEDVKILLRINYDKKTLNVEDLYVLIEEFPEQYKKNILIDYRHTSQSRYTISEPIKTDKNLYVFSKLTDSKGFISSHASSFSCGKSVSCYSDRFYNTVINYTGKIHKCTLHLEREAGVLNEDGTISWHQEAMQKLYAKATFENEKCLECKHLPICLGACSQKLYDQPLEYPCVLKNMEITPEQFVIDVYNKKMESIRNSKTAKY